MFAASHVHWICVYFMTNLAFKVMNHGIQYEVFHEFAILFHLSTIKYIIFVIIMAIYWTLRQFKTGFCIQYCILITCRNLSNAGGNKHMNYGNWKLMSKMQFDKL